MDLRTIQYYLQAAEWLGLMEPGPERLLTPLGLEIAFGKQPERAYARAVWAQPLVAELMAARGRVLPSVEDVVLAIGRAEPQLAPATVRRRASAVRSLIAPALDHTRHRAPEHLQLDLPLVPRAPGPPPVLSPGPAIDADPDVYRFIFGCLLDHGELTLGQLRALLDRAGCAALPIGGYVDLALQRGDAIRRDERLVVSVGAVERRDLVASTAGVIFSHPAYRQWLRDLRDADLGDRPAQIRRNQHAVRFGAWDVRLLGRRADAHTLDQALAGIVLDRSPDSYPLAGDAGPSLEPITASYLDIWEEPDLIVCLPPALEILRGGLAAVNRALQAARQGTSDVAIPDISSRPVLIHGGLLHPGEPLPRSVPDVISLRQRTLMNAPYAAVLAALLLLHREEPERFAVRSVSGQWCVTRSGRPLGATLDVLDTFFLERGQIPSRRPVEGLGAVDLLAGLQEVRITHDLGGVVVLDERLFHRLRAEPEQIEIHSLLRPLADALEAHLDQLEPIDRRAPT